MQGGFCLSICSPRWLQRWFEERHLLLSLATTEVFREPFGASTPVAWESIGFATHARTSILGAPSFKHYASCS